VSLAKFSNVVSIQIFNNKSENPSFYAKHVESNYFSLLFKFKMYPRSEMIPRLYKCLKQKKLEKLGLLLN
jgi:hypothetical protein